MKRTCKAIAIAFTMVAGTIGAHSALSPYFRVELSPVLARGIASWYGREFQGKEMAMGTPYDMYKLTCANRTLPLGSQIKVTNLENGRCLFLRVTDRGPFYPHRILDVSYAAAKALGFAGAGLARVQIQMVRR